MEKIIDALLEQRKRLIQEICDLDFNSANTFSKTQALEKQVAGIDNNILKLIPPTDKPLI